MGDIKTERYTSVFCIMKWIKGTAIQAMTSFSSFLTRNQEVSLVSPMNIGVRQYATRTMDDWFPIMTESPPVISPRASPRAAIDLMRQEPKLRRCICYD